MAAIMVLHRTNKVTSCPHCGQGGLEIVFLGKDPANIRPNNPNGWCKSRYIPFGTDDFSGSIHSVFPCNKTAANPAPAPAPRWGYGPEAPTPEAPTPEAAAPEAPTLHLAPLEKRLDAVESAISGFKPEIDKIGDHITAIDTKITNDLKAMQDNIAILDKARPIVITIPKTKPINIGRQHHNMVNAIACLRALGDSGVLYLVGEAGSGKSTAPEIIAQGLGVTDWSAITMHDYITAPDILGFMSPLTGQYVETEAYRRYVNGGLMAVDEINRASAEAAAVFNGLTSTKRTGFPNGLQTRHPDCYFMAMGNNFGTGADSKYIGTMRLDAATLSRFFYLPWDMDWGLLGDSLGMPVKANKAKFLDPGSPRNDKDPVVQEWAKLVQNVMVQIDKSGIEAVLGARAVINGWKLLQAGIDERLVRYGTMWAHMSVDDAESVRTALGLTY